MCTVAVRLVSFIPSPTPGAGGDPQLGVAGLKKNCELAAPTLGRGGKSPRQMCNAQKVYSAKIRHTPHTASESEILKYKKSADLRI